MFSLLDRQFQDHETNIHVRVCRHLYSLGRSETRLRNFSIILLVLFVGVPGARRTDVPELQEHMMLILTTHESACLHLSTPGCEQLTNSA